MLSAASPAFSGNTVVVPYSSGEVTAFDAEKGELKWADAVIRSTRTHGGLRPDRRRGEPGHL